MKNKSRVLSLREFAKLAGMSYENVRYHIDKGHIKATTREVLGISEDQLDVIKRFAKSKSKDESNTA